MDARRSILVVRVRMTMGNGLPPVLYPHDGDSANGGRPITVRFGRFVHMVERCIALQQERAFGGTVELADQIVDAVKRVCNSESVWQHAKKKGTRVLSRRCAE